MREAAADLNFEEAARLRDETKRLRATEMAVVDDPTVRDVIAAQSKGLRGRGLPAVARSAEAGRSKLGRPGMRGGWKRR